MTFLDQIPAARNMPTARHHAARRQLMDVVTKQLDHVALGRARRLPCDRSDGDGQRCRRVLSSSTPTTIRARVRVPRLLRHLERSRLRASR